MAEFRDTAPLILTRKFYFTITLPQKIKQRQTPFPELYYEDCRYIKKASSYETDHFDCDVPEGEKDHSLSPRTSSRAREYNNLCMVFYLFICLFIYLFLIP